MFSKPLRSSQRTVISLSFVFIVFSGCASLKKENLEAPLSSSEASKEAQFDDQQGGRENPTSLLAERLSFDQRLDQSLAEKTSLLPLIRELEQKPLSSSDRELHRALIQREMLLYPQHLNELQANRAIDSMGASVARSRNSLKEQSRQESWWQRNRTGVLWSSLLLLAFVSSKYEIEVSLP